MPDHPNLLLRRLNPEIFERVVARGKIVELALTKVLAYTDGPLHHVYFPHSGVISNVVELLGGGAIETNMVGRDGVFGASQALDGKVSLNHVVVQIPGVATVVEADDLAALALEYPEFRKLLLAYEHFSYAQVQQTAACNAVHRVAQRLCKWLLRMHELTGDELPLTQEFLAQMMGVRRTSVTEIAGELADAGLISYRRARVQVLDVEGLKARTCECHDELRVKYQKLFHEG